MNPTTQTPILEHLREKAQAAFRNVSFSPERRGDHVINDYSAELVKDIEELKAQGIEDEIISKYRNRYEGLLISWLSKQSNCFSVMITGPGNFPIRRHEKANRSEQKHYEIFREWRERAKKSIIRKSKPQTTYASEIDRYRGELEAMKRNHELMKAGNIAIKKAKKDGSDISEYLISTFGVAPHMIEWTMKWGFGLQNNLANIKRIEQRIKYLEFKETKRADEETAAAKYKFDQGEFVVNYEADRIQIFFDSRPNSQELAEWKNRGLNTYKWSPYNKCWQRKITGNAISHLKRMINGTITKL